MADTPTCSEFSIEVPAPKDAENRKVPLDTKVMYNANGDELEVRWFTFSTGPYGPGWSVKVYDPSDGDPSDDRGNTLPLDFMHLNQPDSWEMLEKDLSRAAKFDAVVASCRYFTAGRCADCRMHNGFTCGRRKTEQAFADVLERIRKLRGEGE